MAPLLYAGIDEAGLGPLLGPLCFGYVAVLTQEEQNLWETLSSVISQDRKDHEKLCVLDSKQIYPGRNGLFRLEETALSFYFALQERVPIDLQEFLSASPVQASDEVLRMHPWYRELSLKLPRKVNTQQIVEKGTKLRKHLHNSGVEILTLSSRAVPEAELNESLATTDNKATTHFQKGSEALRWIVENAKSDQGTIQIDRHGMRSRYAPLLAQAFPGWQIWIEQERKGESYYRIQNENKSFQISFLEKGESKSFFIALASIFAKYTRELMMECWNRYFSGIAPGVKPTAGYYTDAQRYLREAGAEIQSAQIPQSLLIRSR